jgi:ABC-2 type transport system permease protein
MTTSPSLQADNLGAPARATRRPSGGFGLASLTALYTLTLRQHLHGKRWFILGALFLLPAVLAAVVRLGAPDVPGSALEFLFVFLLIPQALLPLLALLYGTGIVQDEQEEQTFTYLLMRPIPKWVIYIVKMLATVTTSVVLVAVFTALTYVVIFAGADTDVEHIPLRCFKAICFHSLSVLAYCSLFGLLSLFTRRALVLGFLYATIVEGLLGNLPFGIRLLTIIYYARIAAYRSMTFLVAEHNGVKADFAADAWQLDLKNDPNLIEHPTLRMCLLVLLVGSFLATVLGAYLCYQREFHVKTPEGS